ncbi:hypothetical protein DL98DRAFT_518115 [Cadophora sp. DSE1049]|nr:hypothetical protein DL98DRAFT_518115 [Cadophora sp. DSE1049]
MARAVPTRLTSGSLPLLEALILNVQAQSEVQICPFQTPLPTFHSSSHTNSELQERQDKFTVIHQSRLHPLSHTASPLISEKNVLSFSPSHLRPVQSQVKNRYTAAHK